ncbi:MAG: hypothetical protein EU542_02205 [Promethearchaeota archaeon]|nr:MAG: hypothetical protein EU542_02205 [Candidatus Lokiarchaeota archaeon]
MINEDESSFEKYEVVKRYFTRIFNVLSREIRQELLELDLTEEELKEIKKELAFLREDQQKEYINEFIEHKKVNSSD